MNIELNVNKQLILESIFNSKIQDPQLGQDVVNSIKDNTSSNVLDVAGHAVPGLANLGGYNAAKEVGHGVAGLMTGRAGGIGAVSNNLEGVNVTDAYSTGNTLGHVGMGSVGGALLGAATGNEEAMLAGAAGGAVGGSLAPAVGYGIGKLFGGDVDKQTYQQGLARQSA